MVIDIQIALCVKLIIFNKKLVLNRAATLEASEGVVVPLAATAQVIVCLLVCLCAPPPPMMYVHVLAFNNPSIRSTKTNEQTNRRGVPGQRMLLAATGRTHLWRR